MVDIPPMAEIGKVDILGYWMLGDIELKYGRNKVEIPPMAEIWKVDIDGYWILGDIVLKYGRGMGYGRNVGK